MVIGSLLVFTNAFVKSGRMRGITVINRKYLVAAIERQKKPGSGVMAVWEKREEIAAALRGKEVA